MLAYRITYRRPGTGARTVPLRQGPLLALAPPPRVKTAALTNSSSESSGPSMKGACVFLVSLLLCASAYSMSPPLLGGKSERAVDDHATQLARTAVTEIGAKANVPHLSLVKVTKLSTQVVAGIKYYFELETKDGAGKIRHYEAQVWEKPGGYDNSAPVELLKYKELGQAPAAATEDWSAAAASAVTQINMRSNSLVPYTLEHLESATPVDGGAKLVLKLKRGDKHETMNVHVANKPEGRYGLLSFAPVG